MQLRLAHSHSVSVWPPSPLAQARLKQCLALAVLLHILLVILFGTAPGGTARPGEGVWGRINVTLRDNKPGSGAAGTPSDISDIPVQPAPQLDTGPPGKAAQQRFGGAVRSETAPPAPAEPGAAQLGRWNPDATPALNEAVPEKAPDKVLEAPADTRLERVQKLTPLASPGVAAEAVAPLPAQRAVSVPRLPAAETERGVERLQQAPALSPAAPARAPEAVESLPVQPAIEAPAPPLSTLQAPADTSAPLTPLPAAQKLMPLAAPAPAAALAPGGLPRASDLPTAGEPPRGQPQATGTAPKAVGAPDAGSRLGHDVATAPSAAASAPRAPLDLRLPKGGELARRQGPGGVFQMMPVPPEKKSKLAEDMEKAAREDCRTAHSGAGLLAPLAIAADTVRGKGCKW